jgi:hypothetical protein
VPPLCPCVFLLIFRLIISEPVGFLLNLVCASCGFSVPLYYFPGSTTSVLAVRPYEMGYSGTILFIEF